MRILHLHSSIGLNGYHLSVGEKKNNVNSEVLIDNPTLYSNKADIIFRYTKNKYIDMARKIIFCIKSSRKYDVIHYNFGSMFIETKKLGLFGWDLKYFKKKHKVITVTFQGSDARQAKYCIDNYEITHYSKSDLVDHEYGDKLKREKIDFYDKNADLIYATNPDLLNILPKRAKFRPYTKLQPEEWTPCYSDYAKKKTVILHAPTSKKVKGTEYVIDAIERLVQEGFDIEFLLLQNVPNNKVVDYYKKADLVIDQLLVGWYGGFAVECMALGKPVACYIRESDMGHIPEQMNIDMPIIRVTKDTLYQQIKEVIEDKSQLQEIAYKSRQYVEKWHDPKKIAFEIISDYTNILNNKLV